MSPYLARIVADTEIPQWVADEIPDDPPPYVNWLIRAVSLAGIYAGAAVREGEEA